MTTFLLCPHVVEKESMWALWSLLIRRLIPSWGATLITSPNPNYLPLTPTPNTVTLELRLQDMNWGGGDTSKTIASTLQMNDVLRGYGVYNGSFSQQSALELESRAVWFWRIISTIYWPSIKVWVNLHNISNLHRKSCKSVFFPFTNTETLA